MDRCSVELWHGQRKEEGTENDFENKTKVLQDSFSVQI